MKVHHSCIPGGVGVRGPRPVRVRARKTRPASNLNYHAIYSRFPCTTLLERPARKGERGLGYILAEMTSRGIEKVAPCHTG